MSAYCSQDTSTHHKFLITETNSLIIAHFSLGEENNYYISSSCYISFRVFYQILFFFSFLPLHHVPTLLSHARLGQLAAKGLPAGPNVLPFSRADFRNLLSYDHPY